MVVHIDHGIGKYKGFKSIFANNIPHDCLIIEYAGGDKLFLPIENLRLLSKYGQEVGEVDKLGRTDQYSREGYLSTGGLAIGWAILCFGLADKIYI